MTTLKNPEDVTSLEDVRVGIDHYDREIFQALQERLRYVLAAAQFKPTEESIPAPERVAVMLEERRQWAIDAGFDEDFIKTLYEHIIYWNIQQQILYWREMHGKD
ncbi:isochorismate lyase [Ectopseudomonas mendocina]|uniref:chorismate mutase n=1 Tax=Ectopseudomonas mendocina TaxID=300 RepID=A0ABZ2RK59_ECTME